MKKMAATEPQTHKLKNSPSFTASIFESFNMLKHEWEFNARECTLPMNECRPMGLLSSRER
jgi:hypothetical protein